MHIFKGFRWSDEKMHPLMVDVQIQMRDGGIGSWCPNNPVTERLILGTDNPADLGWLLFVRFKFLERSKEKFVSRTIPPKAEGIIPRCSAAE
jgi:hypothetical protein